MSANVGDVVRYKLPSGVEGTCLLTEEGHSEVRGAPMFLGHEELKNKDTLDIRVVHLYPNDILYAYEKGAVSCRECGHNWDAVRPPDSEPLECPGCGSMAGRA